MCVCERASICVSVSLSVSVSVRVSASGVSACVRVSSRAAMAAVERLPLGGSPYGRKVMLCANDWQVCRERDTDDTHVWHTARS